MRLVMIEILIMNLGGVLLNPHYLHTLLHNDAPSVSVLVQEPRSPRELVSTGMPSPIGVDANTDSRTRYDGGIPQVEYIPTRPSPYPHTPCVLGAAQTRRWQGRLCSLGAIVLRSPTPAS